MVAGRYELEREIGRGGAGVVWLAHDELLDRSVALKQIGRVPGGSDVDAERANREARLSASLRHPNVVAVYDLAVDDESDEQWLVMEYVDGPTLAQVVRDRGPVAPVQAARIMEQVADALAVAHAAGITHRDVKPSNILLDRNGTAKLTDFGIARSVSDPQLTQTGLLSGSPAYLAPEVASGQRGDMTADVWSWGATLYHLIAGHPPYDVSDNVMGALYRIVHEDPPRPDGAGPLAPVLEGTMVKDPAARWPMSRVRDELAAIVAREVAEETVMMPAAAPAAVGVPAAAPADPTWALTPPPLATDLARADAPWWRRPAVAVLGVLAALLLVVVVLVATLSGGSGPSGRPTDSPSASSTGPTVAGMRAFIEDYVRTVADDPAKAWPMLTARFQRQSGGFAAYRRFWDPATNGTVTDIQADPTTLRVSYRPHFDNWHNNSNPTILDLVFRNGRYLIDAEHTIGFTPSPAARTTTKTPVKKPPAPAPVHHKPGKGHAKGHKKR